MRRESGDYLADIIHYGRRIMDLSAGCTAEDLQADEMRAATIMHYLQIVGEAVNRLPPEVQHRIPENDRIGAMGMRNAIVHGYFQVDLPTILVTVRNDVPRLIADVELILNGSASEDLT